MVLTGTRADYGLLRHTLREILQHPALELCLVVTGTHLSAAHGETEWEIAADQIPIAHRLPILDGEGDVSRASARALEGVAELLRAENPDVLLVLGDRYETFAAGAAATLLNVPLAHVHGGELTLGAVDDALRHSLTKMAWWHFTAAEEYRQRVIRMGEDPQRVFNLGAPAVDALNGTPVPKEELERAVGLELRPPVVLATFHPETKSPGQAAAQVGILWQGLVAAAPGTVVFTRANADAEGNVVNSTLEKLIAGGEIPHARLVDSLGHRNYFSLLRLADVGFGNSSSLVIEAPILCTPSVNVGQRQEGRVRAPSVTDVGFDPPAIRDALRAAWAPGRRALLSGMPHPFGIPGVAKRIVDVLAGAELPRNLIKRFHE